MTILAAILATWAVGASPIALSNPVPAAPTEEVVEIDPSEADAAEPDEPAVAPPPGEADPIEPEPAVAPPADPAAIEPGEAPAAAEPTAAAAAEPIAQVAEPIDPPVAVAEPVAATLDEHPAAAEPVAADPEGETMAQVHPGMDPADYLAMLRELLRAQKEKVALRLEEKIAAKQEAKMATMSSILGWLSLGGLLLLGLPLVLRKKYPGQDALLFEYSALAAGVCVVVVYLFSQVLILLRTIQGALSSIANPQVAVIDASFTVLDDNIEDMVEVGPMLVEAPLAQVASGEQDSLPLAILENIQRINEDVTIFKSIARQFEGVFAMFGYLPVVLTIVAVVLFVVSIKPVIVEIVSLPGRVASGEAAASQVVKQVFRAVGRELLATLCLIGVLIVTTILSGIFLSMAVEPAIEAFLAYVFTSLMYTIASPEFSKAAVYLSVMGALLFLVLNIAVVLVANVLFLGKAQKIFKRRFHDKVKLGAHRRFWGWGTVSLVWVQVLPLLFVAIAQEGIGKLIDALTEGGGEDLPWTAILLSGPAILVIGFGLVFWAGRGLAGVKFILRYRPQDVGVHGPRGSTARYRSTQVG